MSDFLDGLAKLLARIAGLSVDGVHPGYRRRFMQGLGAIQVTPFAGYVGRRYRLGGVVFVARNGAIAKAAQHHEADARLRELSLRLRDRPAERVDAMNDMMRLLRAIIPTWSLCRYLETFNARSGLALDDLALVNMIAFRAVGDSTIPTRVFDEAWRSYTGPLITLLQPAMLIPLGCSGAGRHLPRLYTGPGWIAPVVPRSRGDRYLPTEAAARLEAAAARLRTRSPRPS